MDLYVVLMEFLNSMKLDRNLSSKLVVPAFKGTSYKEYTEMQLLPSGK